MIAAEHIFETVLYAEDLEACERFYHEAIGLEVIRRSELALVLRCGPGVLLIFNPQLSGKPGRAVPAHGTVGPGHVAFGVTENTLLSWRRRLADAGIAIEQEITWDEGGTSIYMRDPAGNSVELAPPTVWGGDWEWGV